MSMADTYNLTTMMAAFPCAKPNPIIMAVTLVPAIAPALFDYAGLTCRDIIKARLGHQAPCGRQLAGKLKGVKPPVFADTFSKLMKFEADFSRAGNKLMILDLASDTVARWTTLAYQLEGCPDALQGAAWQLAFSAPEALAPNTPTPIGGAIVHETGQPGISWPTGAIVPEDWYFSAEFTVEAQSIFSGQRTSLTTWIRKEGPSTYDYPGNLATPGYYGQTTTSHNFLHIHNDKSRGSTQYTFYAMADELALTTSLTATCQVTPFPQPNWALSPLSCFRDLTSKPVSDPAKRNKRSKQPSITDRLTRHIQGGIRRGPPGGKPRSKK